MGKMADNVLDSPPSAWNPDDIGQYRFDQFTKLGFGAELSAFLAESRIDLHRVHALIEKGATPLQAIRIEAGRDWQDDDPSFDHPGFDRLMEAEAIPADAPALDPERTSYFDWLRD